METGVPAPFAGPRARACSWRPASRSAPARRCSCSSPPRTAARAGGDRARSTSAIMAGPAGRAAARPRARRQAASRDLRRLCSASTSTTADGRASARATWHARAPTRARTADAGRARARGWRPRASSPTCSSCLDRRPDEDDAPARAGARARASTFHIYLQPRRSERSGLPAGFLDGLSRRCGTTASRRLEPSPSCSRRCFRVFMAHQQRARTSRRRRRRSSSAGSTGAAAPRRRGRAAPASCSTGSSPPPSSASRRRRPRPQRPLPLVRRSRRRAAPTRGLRAPSRRRLAHLAADARRAERDRARRGARRHPRAAGDTLAGRAAERRRRSCGSRCSRCCAALLPRARPSHDLRGDRPSTAAVVTRRLRRSTAGAPGSWHHLASSDELADGARARAPPRSTAARRARAVVDLYVPGATARRPATPTSARGVRAVAERGCRRPPGAPGRVGVAPARRAGPAARSYFTFRPAPDGLRRGQAVRGVHPMVGRAPRPVAAARLRPRAAAVGRGRLLFHGVARDNPQDERLFALAEVRELTPVRDDARAGRRAARARAELVRGLEAIRAPRPAAPPDRA